MNNAYVNCNRLLFLSTLVLNLVGLSIQFQCTLPSKQGNFTFLAKPFLNSLKTVSLYSSAILNCTTNIKAAEVTASANEFGDWVDVMKSKAQFPNVRKIEQYFVFPSVTARHKVLYKCDAKYEGKQLCLVLGALYVTDQAATDPIIIIPKIRPITSTVGDFLQFYCESVGLGSKTDSFLKWYKKTDTGRVELDKSLVIRQGYHQGGVFYDKEVVSIKNVQKSASGTYICERDHKPSAEIRSESVNLVIEDPTKPYVKLIPSTREIKVLEKASQVKVVCNYVSGLPQPTMKWIDPKGNVFHDCGNHNVNCTLELYSLDYAKHNGRFTCQATNNAGSFNIHTLITVLLPVSLNKPWKQEIANKNEKATLTCSVARGNPPPKIKWYYQAWSCSSTTCTPEDQLWSDVFSKESIVPSSDTATMSSQLTIPASGISGFYSCQADNTVGKDFYNITLHRVDNVPTTFILSSYTKTINMNETFELKCIGSAYVYKSLQWTKNGAILIEEGQRIALTNIDTVDYMRVNKITFSRLIMSDSANYTCTGFKRKGGSNKHVSQLVVKALVAPSITVSSNIVLNETKDNAFLTCDVTGNPLPTVSWQFENDAVKFVGSIASIKDCDTRTEGFYKIAHNEQRNALVICHMSYKRHQGGYTCSAKNKIATAESTFSVTIFAKPKIIEWSTEVSFRQGQHAYLLCKADGNPLPNVTIWKINDKNEATLVKNAGVYPNGTAFAYINTKNGMKFSERYQCQAKNIYGKVSQIAKIQPAAQFTSVKQKTVSSTTIATIVVCVIVFVVLVLVIALWYRRKLEKKYAPFLAPNSNFQLDPDRTLFEQSSDLPYDPDWEFPRERLTFSKMIGSGAFGEVWLAEAQGILILDPRDKTNNACKRRSKIRRSQRYIHMNLNKKDKAVAKNDVSYEKTMVAVKTLKGDASDSDYKDLASELKILIHIGEHKQIVNLLGACTRSGKLCVVLEYCPHGSLLTFLRQRREKFEPVWFKNDTDMENELTYSDLSMVGYQVAKGMDFLASKKCVHRDLAARNVLIGVDYIVKIADFGLARDIYKDEFYMKQTSGLLPVKWMSPESLFDKIYTSQSDVWSFGIVLWEIFTLGGSPYPSLPTEELFSYLEQGRRMDQPDLCPLEIYAIMRDCWERNPNDRPLFSQAVDRIGQILSNHAGNDNSYLRFDGEDGAGFNAPTESDYLIPVEKGSMKKNEEYIGFPTNDKSDNASNTHGDGDDGYEQSVPHPSYLNDDDIRMRMLPPSDDDYANTSARGFADFDEAVV